MFDIANNTEFLTATGVADAPEAERTKLIAELEELAGKRLVVALSERLTEAQIAEFDAITDEKQAYDWLAANLPDFPDLVNQILADLQSDVIAHK